MVNSNNKETFREEIEVVTEAFRKSNNIILIDFSSVIIKKV